MYERVTPYKSFTYFYPFLVRWIRKWEGFVDHNDKTTKKKV